MATYSNMERRLQLKAFLLACFVLHAQAGSLADIIHRRYNHPLVCDRLEAQLNQCLQGMRGIEDTIFKGQYTKQGTQDQITGCLKRELSETHTIRICDGDDSLETLLDCIETSLKDHVIFLISLGVPSFVDRIKTCLEKYEGSAVEDIVAGSSAPQGSGLHHERLEVMASSNITNETSVE
uniref:Secreted protein n=1 Tax=Rhipicephalus appendiculatus TaxID=34631 RepID=A0A131YG77_RHIAP